MVDEVYLTMVMQATIFAIILLLVFVYSVLILFIPRFHHANNMFILNICISIMCFSIFLITYFLMSYFTPLRLFAPSTCNIVLYAYIFATITTPFSFVNFTIHRYFSIAYHGKPFFKKKRWVIISIASQRILELIIGLPYIILQQRSCGTVLWMSIYTLNWSVTVPLFINFIFNVLIFKYVRESTRRVHPQISNTGTSGGNNRQPKITRREILLLRNMIIMFCLFVTGWAPVYTLIIVSSYIRFSSLVIRYLGIVDEVAIFGIIINFFLCNHDIKEYLTNKFRHIYIRYR